MKDKHPFYSAVVKYIGLPFHLLVVVRIEGAVLLLGEKFLFPGRGLNPRPPVDKLGVITTAPTLQPR